MSARAYDKEFRLNIVKLHIENGWTIQKLSKTYGVSTSTITRWVITYLNTAFQKRNA